MPRVINSDRDYSGAALCAGGATHSIFRGVVPGGARGAMAPPDFGISVTPISSEGDRLCLPNSAGIPGFSDLPTALNS